MSKLYENLMTFLLIYVHVVIAQGSESSGLWQYGMELDHFHDTSNYCNTRIDM